MNKIILIGRLTKDPELRYSQSGTAVARFSLAVPRELDKTQADFFYCTAFGKLAQSLTDYCQQGRQLLIEGRVEINQSTDQSGGYKSFTNILVSSAEFLAKPQHENNQKQQQAQQQTPTQNNHQRQNYTKDQIMNAYNNIPNQPQGRQQNMYGVESSLPF